MASLTPRADSSTVVSMESPMMFPVYEIRPPENYFYGDVYRYAGGMWIPDDGEWDLAFACLAGPPICLYVDLPYQKNILWSWTTGHWSKREQRHPRGNAWHYMLREGTHDWGGSWERDRHPNTIAGRNGMDLVCRNRGCANGRSAELQDDNDIMLAGCMRCHDTKELVVVPKTKLCMYCGPTA